jgi:hypothetical protein
VAWLSADRTGKGRRGTLPFWPSGAYWLQPHSLVQANDGTLFGVGQQVSRYATDLTVWCSHDGGVRWVAGCSR